MGKGMAAAGGRRERQPLTTPSVPARIHLAPGTIRVSEILLLKFHLSLQHSKRYASNTNWTEILQLSLKHSQCKLKIINSHIHTPDNKPRVNMKKYKC